MVTKMAATAEQTEIDGETTMGEILARFPGAKRALFARYHIGGCQSCSYDDDETISGVCERNENLPVAEVIEHILTAHETDRAMLIEPIAFKEALESEDPPRLIDLRTREEHEAVTLPDSELYSSELLQTIFGTEPKDRAIVVFDHTGEKALDPTAYLVGHGYTNAKALRGGIDAYAREADKSVPRYKLEFEE